MQNLTDLIRNSKKEVIFFARYVPQSTVVLPETDTGVFS